MSPLSLKNLKHRKWWKYFLIYLDAIRRNRRGGVCRLVCGEERRERNVECRVRGFVLRFAFCFFFFFLSKRKKFTKKKCSRDFSFALSRCHLCYSAWRFSFFSLITKSPQVRYPILASAVVFFSLVHRALSSSFVTERLDWPRKFAWIRKCAAAWVSRRGDNSDLKEKKKSAKEKTSRVIIFVFLFFSRSWREPVIRWVDVNRGNRADDRVNWDVFFFFFFYF